MPGAYQIRAGPRNTPCYPATAPHSSMPSHYNSYSQGCEWVTNSGCHHSDERTVSVAQICLSPYKGPRQPVGPTATPCKSTTHLIPPSPALTSAATPGGARVVTSPAAQTTTGSCTEGSLWRSPPKWPPPRCLRWRRRAPSARGWGDTVNTCVHLLVQGNHCSSHLTAHGYLSNRDTRDTAADPTI